MCRLKIHTLNNPMGVGLNPLQFVSFNTAVCLITPLHHFPLINRVCRQKGILCLHRLVDSGNEDR